MQREIDQLRESLKKVAREHGPASLFDATVTAVDSDAFTCDIMLDELPQYDVRLRAVISDSHSVDVLPAVNTSVIVAKLDDDDFIVIASDKITSWRVTVGQTVVGIEADGVQISKGNETLNKILTDLVNAVISVAAAKDAATLTQLLTRIKDLLK